MKLFVLQNIRKLSIDVPAGQTLIFLQTVCWISVRLPFDLFLLVLVITGTMFASNQQVREHFPQDSHSDQFESSVIQIYGYTNIMDSLRDSFLHY